MGLFANLMEKLEEGRDRIAIAMDPIAKLQDLRFQLSTHQTACDLTQRDMDRNQVKIDELKQKLESLVKGRSAGTGITVNHLRSQIRQYEDSNRRLLTKYERFCIERDKVAEQIEQREEKLLAAE